jgi:hypothetical protein
MCFIPRKMQMLCALLRLQTFASFQLPLDNPPICCSRLQSLIRYSVVLSMATCQSSTMTLNLVSVLIIFELFTVQEFKFPHSESTRK